MPKAVIWDVDDVLNGLTAEWFRRVWKPGRPTSTRYEDLVENPPHEVLGVPLAEYLESLDRFRRDHYQTLEPVSEVLDWFRREGSACRHIALSAVPRPYAHLTAAWVVEHFGSWITTFAFVSGRGGPALNERMAQTKYEYLAWLCKGDVLVEDRADTLAAAETLGLKGVLVPRPWNDARAGALRDALRELSDLVRSGPGNPDERDQR